MRGLSDNNEIFHPGCSKYPLSIFDPEWDGQVKNIDKIQGLSFWDDSIIGKAGIVSKASFIGRWFGLTFKIKLIYANKRS
jgi:hypothetical protein